MKAHFRMLAGYNAWANRRLYAAVLALPPGAAARDLGAFFRSPLATLNHVMVADLVWLARLRAIAPPPFDLDHVLHDDMAELDLARRALDDDICRAVEETDPAATIRYRRGDAEMAAPAAELLAHLFNHQTHHRGQVHAMLTRLAAEGVGAGVGAGVEAGVGAGAPALDLVYHQRERAGAS